MKFNLFDRVVLEHDLTDPLIARGTVGVVMEVIPPTGVAVEFFDDDNNTIDVAFLDEALVTPAVPAKSKKNAAAR